MTAEQINKEFDHIITPPNFTVAEYLNFGSRSVLTKVDREMLLDDFRSLSEIEQQRNLNVLFALQPVRLRFGKPLFITCGYRSYRHEIQKGRSGKSWHKFGAIDITCDNVRSLARLTEDWCGGWNFYSKKHFIHFDLGSYDRW